MFVEFPGGVEIANRVLLQQQSVHGLRQSPLNIYNHLRQGLESREFTKSNHDNCLFANGEVRVLFWVDDCIFYSNNSKAIDNVIDNLKDEFLLEKEDGMAVFLRLIIHRDTLNKTVTLTQEHLIDRIIHAMQLEDCNPNFTPAYKIPLCKDLNGETCQEQWNYRSILGMLFYFGGITCLDISYVVYQCTRFLHNP